MQEGSAQKHDMPTMTISGPKSDTNSRNFPLTESEAKQTQIKFKFRARRQKRKRRQRWEFGDLEALKIRDSGSHNHSSITTWDNDSSSHNTV